MVRMDELPLNVPDEKWIQENLTIWCTPLVDVDSLKLLNCSQIPILHEQPYDHVDGRICPEIQADSNISDYFGIWADTFEALSIN